MIPAITDSDTALFDAGRFPSEGGGGRCASIGRFSISTASGPSAEKNSAIPGGDMTTRHADGGLHKSSPRREVAGVGVNQPGGFFQPVLLRRLRKGYRGQPNSIGEPCRAGVFACAFFDIHFSLALRLKSKDTEISWPSVKINDSAPVREPADRWTTAEAAELYDVASWGKGYFSVGKNGHLWVHPDKDPARGHRSQGAGGQPPAARHLAADPDPLRRNPEASPGRNAPGVSKRHRRARLQGHLLLRVSRSRSTSSGRWWKKFSSTAAPTISAWKPARSRSCWPCWPSPTTRRPSSATASRTTSTSRWSMLAKKIGRQIIPVVEKYTELDLILKHSATRRRAAGDRAAHQAGQPRLGPLEIVGRLSLEVRTHRHGRSAGAGTAESAAAWRIASSCCISIWAARSPTSARSRAR